MNSNLKINSKCSKCGTCLGYGYEFLCSTKDGSVVVKPGTILDSNSKELKELQLICPVEAFEFDANITKQTLLEHLISELRRLEGISVPTGDELKFEKEEYDISIPFASGECRYEYSSESAAERAAQREFERCMYSQIDTIILKIITDYRVKKVKPYYTDNLDEGSVYAKNNKKVAGILKAIYDLYDGSLPSDFVEIDISPSKLDRDMWKMLNKGEILSDGLVSAVRSEFNSGSYSSCSDYNYWDIDDREVYQGTDWRGNPKEKTMYCYKNVRAAFEILAKDILNACSWASGTIEYHANDVVECLVGMYNRELKSLIESKLNLLK